MYEESFFKRVFERVFRGFITLQNYVNAELDKTEMLMYLKNRKLATEIEYYQEIWNIQKKKKKKKKGISKHCHNFQN